jgi:hypothetical protein
LGDFSLPSRWRSIRLIARAQARRHGKSSADVGAAANLPRFDFFEQSLTCGGRHRCALVAERIHQNCEQWFRIRQLLDQSSRFHFRASLNLAHPITSNCLAPSQAGQRCQR